MAAVGGAIRVLTTEEKRLPADLRGALKQALVLDADFDGEHEIAAAFHALGDGTDNTKYRELWGAVLKVCGNKNTVACEVANYIATLSEFNGVLLDVVTEQQIMGCINWGKQNRMMQQHQQGPAIVSVSSFTAWTGTSVFELEPGSSFILQTPWMPAEFQSTPVYVREEVSFAVCELEAYLKNTKGQPLVIDGSPGSGKSTTVAAYFIRQAKRGSEVLYLVRLQQGGDFKALFLSSMGYAELSIGGATNFPPERIRDWLSPFQNRRLDLVVVDGIVGDPAKDCYAMLLNFTARAPSVICSSRGFTVKAGNAIGLPPMLHYMSWRLEDYVAAVKNWQFRSEAAKKMNLFITPASTGGEGSTSSAPPPSAAAPVATTTTATTVILSDEDQWIQRVTDKYYRAGGSARLMFTKSYADIEVGIKADATRCGDERVESDKAVTAVNSLTQRLRDERGDVHIHPVSEFARLLLHLKDYAAAASMLQQLGVSASSVFGYLYEAQCICEFMDNKAMILSNVMALGVQEKGETRETCILHLKVEERWDYPQLAQLLPNPESCYNVAFIPVSSRNPSFDWVVVVKEEEQDIMSHLSTVEKAEADVYVRSVGGSAPNAQKAVALRRKALARGDTPRVAYVGAHDRVAAARASAGATREALFSVHRGVENSDDDMMDGVELEGAGSAAAGASAAGAGAAGAGAGAAASANIVTAYFFQATEALDHDAKRSGIQALCSAFSCVDVIIQRIRFVFVVPITKIDRFDLASNCPKNVFINEKEVAINYYVGASQGGSLRRRDLR